jgi:hypothetical protein
VGADLMIEPTHTKIYESLKPKWEAAIARRNQVCEASKVLGTCKRSDFMDDKGHSEACIQAQAEVNKFDALMYGPETYYRDAYNCFSVLGAYDLSWWRDVAKFQGATGNISRRNAAKLIKMIEEHNKVVRTPDETHSMMSAGDKEYKVFDNAYFEGQKVNKRNWKKLVTYWEKEREDLLRFLKAYANSPSDGTVLHASL